MMPTVGINRTGESAGEIKHQQAGELPWRAVLAESVPTRFGEYRPLIVTGFLGDRPWVMRMRWVDLLFAHWPMPVDALRPLVPASLEIETFDGTAWLGIVPFRMEDVAPRFLPAPPLAGRFPELNVRTYVRHRGRSGVWFLSLDAGNRLAVEGARLGFHLPYFLARMSAQRRDGWIEYRSQRVDGRGAPAALEGRYRPIGPPVASVPGTLDAWLTERRALFAVDSRGHVMLGRIRHPRWPLQPAEAEFPVNTMASAHGVALPGVPPLLHFARRMDVQGWWPQRVE
jgi:uncharacterized protein